MATSIPKMELETTNRTPDNSYPQQEWRVKRTGNDPGRLGKPCRSCAKSVDQVVLGYDEDVENDDKFQMFSGLEGFEADGDEEAVMFLDRDLGPLGNETENFDSSEFLLVDEDGPPIETFFPDDYPPAVARCPPPPPMQMPTGCGDCASSPCECASRHVQRCGLGSLALFIAIVALAAVFFNKRR